MTLAPDLAGLTDILERAKVGFALMLTDRSAFEERLRKGMAFMGLADPNAENKINLSRHLNLFSFELFQAMVCGGESYAVTPLRFAWGRLVSTGLAIPAAPHLNGQTPLADHQLLAVNLQEHLREGTFDNLFAAPSKLLERYRQALVAIDVRMGANLSRGTAFVVARGAGQFLVSCKHNVDPSDGVVVEALTSAADTPIEVGPWWLSGLYDIAAAKLAKRIPPPCFAFSNKAEVFDEVFTLGFPLVPCADSILVGHRGEINGRANLYLQKCPALLISNLVSPGNSGGPVLDRYGRCVGMTINWLEGEWDGQPMRFSAALPAELLCEAVAHAAKA